MSPSAPQMLWLAKAFSHSDYAEHEIRYIGDRASIFHLLWAANLPANLSEGSQPLDRLFRGIHVAFLRSAWNDKDAFFVGFKGGDNKANHSHLDLGTFVLDALGQRWALDLGSDDYNLPGYFGREKTFTRISAPDSIAIDRSPQRRRNIGQRLIRHDE